MLGITPANVADPAKTLTTGRVPPANDCECKVPETESAAKFATSRNHSQSKQTLPESTSSHNSHRSHVTDPPTQKPPGLLAAVRLMAKFYEFDEDWLTRALADARQQPDHWRERIRNDSNAEKFLNPLPKHQVEVLEMLKAEPSLRYAFTTRAQGAEVLITLAVRDVAVCELSMPGNRYDPVQFWNTIRELTSE